jgi:hypothetical protein
MTDQPRPGRPPTYPLDWHCELCGKDVTWNHTAVWGPAHIIIKKEGVVGKTLPVSVKIHERDKGEKKPYVCRVCGTEYPTELQRNSCVVCYGRKEEEVRPDYTKKVMILPGTGRPMGKFAEEVGEFFKDKAVIFYRAAEDSVVRLKMQTPNEEKDEEVLGFKQVKDKDFVTYIEQLLNTGIEISTSINTIFRPKSVSPNTASIILESDQFKGRLPLIKRIFTVPMPILKKNKLVFPRVGYDSNFYSWMPSDAPVLRTDMPLDEAKRIIKKVFKEFCFVGEQDRVNAIAALLTPYCRRLYPRETCRTPIFFFKGNREGAGKDYCSGINGIVYEGVAIEDPPIAGGKENHDEEFRKKITTALKSGRGRIHSSNNKGFINSAILESISTAEVWNDRQLGSNLNLTFPNTLELSLSGNVGISYTPDLARRSVFINLAFAEENSNDRTYEEPKLHEWVREHRGDILSALFAFVREWVDAGMPPGSKPFTSYPEWASTIGGIMESVGYASPCTPNDTQDSIGGDSETRDMKTLFELTYEKWGEQWILKRQVMDEFDNRDSEFAGLFGWLDWDKETGKARTKFGMLVNKFVNREFSGIRLDMHEDRTHPIRNQYMWTKKKKLVEMGTLRKLDTLDTLDTSTIANILQEEKIYKSAGAIQPSQGSQIKPTSDTDVGSKATITLKFLKDTMPFVGSDMQSYGPYKEGDIKELPLKIAKLLIKRNVAVEA